MYKKGDAVLYGVHGVCTVADVEEQRVGQKVTRYLVLVPRDQGGSRYLVPMENPKAMAKLRPVLTAAELETLLSSGEVRQNAWIADENARKQAYRELIGSGDRMALLRMIHAIHAHRKALEPLGRRLHLCDENFLRDAQRLLGTEFSLILGIPASEVGSYILQKWNRLDQSGCVSNAPAFKFQFIVALGHTLVGADIIRPPKNGTFFGFSEGK